MLDDERIGPGEHGENKTKAGRPHPLKPGR
jgi:hypothetical protein